MEEYCVMCGEVIPEGTHVCVHCGELQRSDQQNMGETEAKKITPISADIQDLPLSGMVRLYKNMVKRYWERYNSKMPQK